MRSVVGLMARFSEVLEFWLTVDDPRQDFPWRAEWFQKNELLDLEIVKRFKSLHETAASGALDSWLAKPAACLALVILLDQFPRNMFRGSPRAFSTDANARRVARHALECGYDKILSPYARMFFYLPFEHSEKLSDQELCLQLMAGLGNDDLVKYAQLHHDIIKRFGRFPHRNDVLGRETSEEEREFLAGPNSSF